MSKVKHIRNTVAKILNRKEGLKTLWISGGVDSMVLLDTVKRRKDIKIIHFHHGDKYNKSFRDEASLLVKNKCQELGIPCEIIKYEGDDSSETAMREFRVNSIKNDDNIVTAHHADDIFETRLIRIIRGSPVEALDIQKNSMKIMPLGEFTKDEIRKYAKEEAIDFLEDPTNTISDNLRNYIRNEMIPKLTEFHPNFQKGTTKVLEDILNKIK